MTVRELMDVLDGLADDAPVWVVTVTAEDAHRLLGYAETHEEGHVRYPSARPGVVAHPTDDGGVVIITNNF
jgi:hypothetical protein